MAHDSSKDVRQPSVFSTWKSLVIGYLYYTTYVSLVSWKSVSLHVSVETVDAQEVRMTVSLNVTELYVLKIELSSLEWGPPGFLRTAQSHEQCSVHRENKM